MFKLLKIFCAVGPLLMTTGINANAAGMDLKQLQTMLSGLGVTAKLENGRVVVANQGKYGSDILFDLADQNSVVGVSIGFEVILAGKLANIPYAAIMKTNATDRFTFGLCESPESKWLCLGANYDALTLNKKNLRQILDDAVASVEADEPLWNQDKWIATLPKAAEAKATFDAAWEASPMVIQNGMFVTQKAASYGSFTPRPNNVFKSGEDLLIYAEPKYYKWASDAKDSFSFGVVIDAAILDDKGNTIFEQLKSMGPLTFQSREQVSEMMLNLSFSLTGAAPGDYTLRYTFHDVNGPKSAILSLPFKIEG
jgi:hypothetical protein